VTQVIKYYTPSKFRYNGLTNKNATFTPPIATTCAYPLLVCVPPVAVWSIPGADRCPSVWSKNPPIGTRAATHLTIFTA